MLVDFPPYGTTDAQEPARRLRRRRRQAAGQGLGVKANIVPVTGPNRIPFLLTNKVDLLVASLAITPERAKQVEFSKPYAAATIVLYGKKARHQGAGRPEGPAHRRGPRQHAGRGRDRGRARGHRDPPLRRRRIRHAGAAVGPGRCDRLLDHRRRADRQARAGRHLREQVRAAPAGNGRRDAPGPGRPAEEAVERLRGQEHGQRRANKLYRKWLDDRPARSMQ